MPVTADVLKRIIADQKEEQFIAADYFQRSREDRLQQLAANKEVIVITGIRRCGKSVLLHRLRQHLRESNYYFNFEDERLATFTVEDLQILQRVFIELFGMQKTFYFDEIQNIPGWEMFIRRLYNSGNKIFITGSNANLFSEELGTRLTGRYIAVQIYPFSFREYVQHKLPQALNESVLSTAQIGQVKKLFNEYCLQGGIPEYVKHAQIDYLHALYESIIYRDIIARYRLSNDNIIKKLVFFLASNCSKEVTYNSLRTLIGAGSTTTVSDYCKYLENSYLCFLLNRYSESVKSQLQSPKKIYFIDHALAKMVGFHFSADFGRMLENVVFIELKRRGYEIYYYREQKECDFIVRQDGKARYAIQVCASLVDSATKRREIEGLLAALTHLSLSDGYILTEDEESIQLIEQDGINYKIRIMPIWQWLIKDSTCAK